MTDISVPTGENPGPIGAMLAVADRITAHRLAVEEIRELHRPFREQCCKDWCECCGFDYPCPTIAILERHGL